MESSSMEIKVRYCRDLKTFNFFQKLSVYATASIKTDDPKRKPEQNQQQSTPIDGEGDGNPEWNHKIRFDLDEAWIKDPDHMFIHFEVHAIVIVFGNKIIGEAHIPLKDLIDESNGIVRFVSYEVRGLDGKVNGMLNFSYKVVRKDGNGEKIGGKIGAIDEVLYPKVEVESDHPPPPPPPKVEYPSIESSNPTSETSSEVHHMSHEANYPPPHDTYYSMPPPYQLLPPPMMHHHPPPPPHAVHGRFYHPPPPPPPPPPPILHWPFPNNHDSRELGGHGSHSFEGRETSKNREMWHNRSGRERQWRPSFWNGR